MLLFKDRYFNNKVAFSESGYTMAEISRNQTKEVQQ